MAGQLPVGDRERLLDVVDGVVAFIEAFVPVGERARASTRVGLDNCKGLAQALEHVEAIDAFLPDPRGAVLADGTLAVEMNPLSLLARLAARRRRRAPPRPPRAQETAPPRPPRAQETAPRGPRRSPRDRAAGRDGPGALRRCRLCRSSCHPSPIVSSRRTHTERVLRMGRKDAASAVVGWGAHPGSLAPRTERFSIFGGTAKSSSARAISAAAMGPARCCLGPSASGKASTM